MILFGVISSDFVLSNIACSMDHSVSVVGGPSKYQEYECYSLQQA